METERKPRDIEQVIKLFSLLYLLLILIGLLYNFFYYQTYGIIITQYIDLGEVLTLFSPLLTDIYFVMVFFWLPVSFISRANYLNIRDKTRKEHMSRTWFVILIAFALVAIATYIISFWHPAYLRTTVMAVVVGLITCLPNIIDDMFDFFDRIFHIKVPMLLKEVILLLMLLVAFTFWAVYSQIGKLKRRSISQYYEIIFKGVEPSLKTDSTVIYLGRTKGYIFIHNYQTKSTKVLNVSDVKEFIVTQ